MPDINVSDWFVGGLYVIFILGVVLYSYFEIKIKK